MDVYKRLEQLSIELPQAPSRGGLYKPIRITGNLLYTSGIGPNLVGKEPITGKVGGDLNLAQGEEAAKNVILNMLSIMQAELKNLNHIKRVIKILAFVASDGGFDRQPEVINAASQMLIDIFGENGEHARSAIGTNQLPGNIPVEIEAIFELEEEIHI